MIELGSYKKKIFSLLAVAFMLVMFLCLPLIVRADVGYDPVSKRYTGNVDMSIMKNTLMSIHSDYSVGKYYLYKQSGSSDIRRYNYVAVPSACDDMYIGGVLLGDSVRVYSPVNPAYNIYFSEMSTADVYNVSVLGSLFVSLYEGDTYKTNIPLFSSVDDCTEYMETGDVSNAVNPDDLLTYDDSVELPQNLVLTKVDKNDTKCYVEWKQSDDLDLTGYQTEIWRKPRYCHVSLMGLGSTSFLPLDMTKYKTIDTRNVNRELIDTFETTQIDYERLKNQYSDETWTLSTTTLDNCQYFIRNVKDRKYVSNWVRVIFTNDGWYIKDNDESLVAPGGSYDELPATDENGNVVSDPSTQKPVQDSPYNPDYIGVPDDSAPELNTDGILSFLKDLFSENGIVGIVKVIFGWMPTWMVAFISLFFTMLIALLIYRVVRG